MNIILLRLASISQQLLRNLHKINKKYKFYTNKKKFFPYLTFDFNSDNDNFIDFKLTNLCLKKLR